ncbi:hypothetical protein GCM10023080_082760 [Streptomyces pseudoechinosporeus]
MQERDETIGGPIGERLAAWRVHRRLSQEDLASRAGLEVGYVASLETGADWMDRRGRLAALAGALRLDVSDLTGQPYPPSGADHAAVRAVAFHLRRRVLRGTWGHHPARCSMNWHNGSKTPQRPTPQETSTVSPAHCPS